jgi:hypothetical protein
MKRLALLIGLSVLVLGGCDNLGEEPVGTAGLNADGSVTVYSNGTWLPDLDGGRGGIQVWDAAQLGEHVDFTATGAGGHSGTRAILVDNEGNLQRSIAVFLSQGIETFKMDRLSCFVKVSTAVPVNFTVSFGAALGDDYQNGSQMITVPPDNEWHEMTVPVTLNGFERIRFLLFSVPDNAGKLYIDDVRFIPLGL